MDFVTLDFETATSDRASACEIGLTKVKNDQILETRSWLIRPRKLDFNFYNILIHGIRPEHVKFEPEFDDLWEEIFPWLDQQFIIAHNASFDISVLRSTLDVYHLPYPDLHYACSVAFSRVIWPGLVKYNLKDLCNHHQIDFVHHRAGNDSEATARLSLIAFEQAGISDLKDFQEKLMITPGRMTDGIVEGPKSKIRKKTKKTPK